MNRMLIHPEFDGTFKSVDDFKQFIRSGGWYGQRDEDELAVDLLDVTEVKVAEGYEYEGVTYHCERDHEDDNVKIHHTVSFPWGETHVMDWSPYSTPTMYDFHLWVDVGMPDRVTNGPLDRKDLEAMKEKMNEH